MRDAGNSNVLVSYLHATGNQRVSRTISNGGVPGDTSLNGTTHFYYAGWQLHDEYDVDPGESLKYQYVWGPRYPDELICRDDRTDSTTVAHLNDGLAGGAVGGSSGGRQYQHHDRGWNIRSVTDEAGAVQEQYLYDPFGHPFIFAPDGVTQRSVSSTDQAYGFTSQRFDYETGLWYFKHRYLDDGLGRFISRDPAGYVDGMNLYTAYFVMTGTDPLGLYGIEDQLVHEGIGERWANAYEPSELSGQAKAVARETRNALPAAYAAEAYHLGESVVKGAAATARGAKDMITYGVREAATTAGIDAMSWAPGVDDKKNTLNAAYAPVQGAIDGAKETIRGIKEGDPTVIGRTMQGGSLAGVTAGRSLLRGKGVPDGPSVPTEAYNRRLHYGNTPTKADRKALGLGSGQVADHNPPLVKRYYDGDPTTGEAPGHTSTQGERRSSANDRSRMQPQSRKESNAQGADMARYSQEQKRKYNLDKKKDDN